MTYPSDLPEPTILNIDDFQTIVDRVIARLRTIGDARVESGQYAENPYSELTAASVAAILVEALIYEHVSIYEHINEDVRQLLVSFATGTNLDARARDFGIAGRNPDTESDIRLRQRIFLQWHSLSASGTRGWYFHKAITENTDPNNMWSLYNAGVTKDLVGKRPTVLQNALGVSGHAPGLRPGDADHRDLSRTDGTAYLYLQVNPGVQEAAAGGIPTDDFIQTLFTYLDKIENRIICDRIRIKPVKTVRYRVEATLTLEPTADRDTVLAAARDSLKTLTETSEVIDRNIQISEFYNVLQVSGVHQIRLSVTPADAAHVPSAGNGNTGVSTANTPLQGSVYAETAEEWDDAYVPVAAFSTVDTGLNFALSDIPYDAEAGRQVLVLDPVARSSRQMSIELPRAYHGAGDSPTYTYSLRNLPSGFRFYNNTLILEGAPRSAGVTDMEYQVSDGTSTAIATVRLEIQ